MELTNIARNAIRFGSVKVRVTRSGMLQQMTFNVKKVTLGNVVYTELYIDRQIDMSELTRLANEIKLPVEGQNGRAFPQGTSAQDFQSIS